MAARPRLGLGIVAGRRREPGHLRLATHTLHAAPSGRVYAAYGGVYVAVALAWLWSVDRIRPTSWDLAGVAITLAGMAIIAYQPKA